MRRRLNRGVILLIICTRCVHEFCSNVGYSNAAEAIAGLSVTAAGW